MESLLQILRQARDSLSSLRLVQFRVPEAGMVLFFALLVFGILNGFLGYRLLRFWMMLVGFAIGAGVGFGVCYLARGEGMGRRAYFLAMVVTGIGVALITFFYYRAGIFLMVSAIGGVLGIYLLRPNSSAMFYLCILIGIGLGLLALRFERNIVIFITALFGGALSAYCSCKLLNLDEIPYGILAGIGLFLMGLVVQLLMNPVEKREEKKPGIRLGLQTLTGQTEADKRNDAFYEAYMDGMDVFDEDVESVLPYTPSLAEKVTGRLRSGSSRQKGEAQGNSGKGGAGNRAKPPRQAPFRQERLPNEKPSSLLRRREEAPRQEEPRRVANIQFSKSGEGKKQARRGETPGRRKVQSSPGEGHQGTMPSQEKRVYDYKLESRPGEKKKQKGKDIDVYIRKR